MNNDPTEAIAVLYDVSGSMICNYFDDIKTSRLDAVSAFFSAFGDKTIASEQNHIV